MKRFFQLFLFLYFVLLFSNCSDNRCNESTDVLLKAEITVNDPVLETGDYLKNLSIYAPEWTDSVHYSSSSFMLDLSSFSDTTTFVFTSKSWIDTVWIYYKRQLVFQSQECGFVNNFTVDSARFSENNIDSIIWVNKKLTTLNDGHVKIYF